MILRVLPSFRDGVHVRAHTEDDGVNPPDVFEVLIHPIAGTREFRVELRAGTAYEFAEHDDDTESPPATLVDLTYDADLRRAVRE